MSQNRTHDDMSAGLGDQVSQIVGAATQDVVIVAPYIKSGAMSRVLSVLSEDLASMTCVTRWLPEDIASGASDLNVLDMVSAVRNGRLLVHPHLHAKYYRGDQRCLIGSANLTSRGLGWSTPSNVEMLVELSFDFTGLQNWEATLLSSSIEATEELRDQLTQEVERITSQRTPTALPEIEVEQADELPATQWVPTCSTPDLLWDVYSQSSRASLILESTRFAALEDLRALGPPRGLNKSLFEVYIASIMRQMPLVIAINDLASRGLSDSEARALIEDILGTSMPYDPRDTWDVFKSWLTYFVGSSYRVETGEDVLVRGHRFSKS